MNTDELEQAIYMAERRVLEMQAKLHRWAVDDPHRRFGDLFNLVADPAFLLLAWNRVRGNKGAKTAGVDGHTAASIAARGVEEFLGALRDSLKDRNFCPLQSRERMIPKPGIGQAPPPRDPHDPRPGGPGDLEAGAGADLRGGFPAVFLRVPPWPSGA